MHYLNYLIDDLSVKNEDNGNEDRILIYLIDEGTESNR